MFKNLKTKFAKVALVVLAMQLASVGIGTGANSVYAEDSAPTGGVLTLTTDMYPTPGIALVPTTDNTYTLTQPLSGSDQFHSLYLQVIDNNLDMSDTAVFIDGTENGYMHSVGLVEDGIYVWKYKPGIPVNFAEGTHNLQATFTDESDNETTLTANFTVDSTIPTLSSVTAVLGGVSQTKLADESLDAVIGQTVGSITAKTSENVLRVDLSTPVEVTISGATIPEGTPYGTLVVSDEIDHQDELVITPNPGNDALALEGTFTFTVVAGTIRDIAGNLNEETTFTLVVSSNVISAITPIVGTPQVGSVLTVGALTPAAATATYQWQSSVAADGVYANIPGATLNKYTPVASDLGKYIRVVATGTGLYTGSGATSAATTVVVAAPVAPNAVTGLTSVVDADGHVSLSWVNPTAGTFSNVRVYRVGDFYVDLGAAANSFTDLTTEKGRTYEYVVMVINSAGNYASTPPLTVAVPAAEVAAAAVSDTTSYVAPEEDTNTNTDTEVKALKVETDDTKDDKKDEENGFPTWGILLLLILAAVGGYLIWSQKSETEVAPETKPKSTPKK